MGLKGIKSTTDAESHILHSASRGIDFVDYFFVKSDLRLKVLSVEISFSWIQITCNLNLDLHISNVVKQENIKMSVFYGVSLLESKILDLLYKMHIRSRIDYCLQVYGPSLKIQQIERLTKYIPIRQDVSLEIAWLQFPIQITVVEGVNSII